MLHLKAPSPRYGSPYPSSRVSKVRPHPLRLPSPGKARSSTLAARLACWIGPGKSKGRIGFHYGTLPPEAQRALVSALDASHGVSRRALRSLFHAADPEGWSVWRRAGFSWRCPAPPHTYRSFRFSVVEESWIDSFFVPSGLHGHMLASRLRGALKSPKASAWGMRSVMAPFRGRFWTPAGLGSRFSMPAVLAVERRSESGAWRQVWRSSPASGPVVPTPSLDDRLLLGVLCDLSGPYRPGGPLMRRGIPEGADAETYALADSWPSCHWIRGDSFRLAVESLRGAEGEALRMFARPMGEAFLSGAMDAPAPPGLLGARGSLVQAPMSGHSRMALSKPSAMRFPPFSDTSSWRLLVFC